MSRIVSILVLVLCLGVTQCSDGVKGVEETPARELTVSETKLVSSGNAFGIKLFKEILQSEDGDGNVFVSPLSVSMALGMTYNGAAGETEEAMRGVLEFGDLTNLEINESYKSLIELLSGLDPSVTFGLGNSIWYRLGLSFKQEFIDLNRSYFDAEVTGLDFYSEEAAAIINRWVDEKTAGRIKEIVEHPIADDTIMFLINAIYFKGAWTSEFDPEETADDTFTLPDGSKRPCRMMNQSGAFRYQRTLEFEAVDLPYGDGDFSMVVFLPAGKMTVDELAAMLTQEKWDEWLDGFSEGEMILQLPKFTMEYEIKLKDVLTSLGMEIAFSPLEADFRGIYEGPENAFISQVKHKTFVAVDEEGTEAAGVTSVEVGRTSMPPTMRVDRPFLFAIRDSHSDTILFIGKIIEPTLQ